MNINIQYLEMPFSEKVTEYILQTLNVLKEYYPWISGADVSFKRMTNLNEVKEICEIELKMAGLKLFASSSEAGCELAAKATTIELNKLLKERKQVLRAR